MTETIVFQTKDFNGWTKHATWDFFVNYAEALDTLAQDAVYEGMQCLEQAEFAVYFRLLLNERSKFITDSFLSNQIRLAINEINFKELHNAYLDMIKEYQR